MGAPLYVDVKLTAAPETLQYSSVDAVLTYDNTLVRPELAELENVSLKEDGKLTVTYGPNENAAVGEDGVTLASIPFTPLKTDNAVFTVSEGAFITLKDTGGAKIPAESGDTLTVNISAAATVIEFDAEYEGLPAGYTLLKYQLPAKPSVTYAYGVQTMHYVYDAGKHYMTYIVTTDEADAGTEALAAKILPTETPFAPTADVNGDAELDVSDAQLAYDLANPSGYYDTFDNLSIASRLGADVDNNGRIDSADTSAVIYAIHHGGELPSVA
jgi:hypothetical protein